MNDGDLIMSVLLLKDDITNSTSSSSRFEVTFLMLLKYDHEFPLSLYIERIGWMFNTHAVSMEFNQFKIAARKMNLSIA